MYTISVANQKGGSGKTTTAVNLSACLADRGYKVLLIDLDPQSQATTCYRADEQKLAGSVFDIFMNTGKNGKTVSNLSVPVYEGVDLLPSNTINPIQEARIASQPKGAWKLKETLKTAKTDYDFAVIDTPPNLGIWTYNAMQASDYAILTVQTSFLALHGVTRLLDFMRDMRKTTKHAPKLWVLPTLFDGRTTFANEVLDDMRSFFKDSMLKTVIRNNVRLSEAASCGIPITTYAKKSYGYEDYSSLTREVLRKIGA